MWVVKGQNVGYLPKKNKPFKRGRVIKSYSDREIKN
jgi:hypothetical protein